MLQPEASDHILDIGCGIGGPVVVGSGPAGEPRYPLPWAATAATSFLVTLDENSVGFARGGFSNCHPL